MISASRSSEIITPVTVDFPWRKFDPLPKPPREAVFVKDFLNNREYTKKVP